jgi:hypothetical protein
MTFVSRLSVVTAYVAFAFVGAIVLGVILALTNNLDLEAPGGLDHSSRRAFSCHHA